MDRPRALLLDDGDLDRVFEALVRAGLEPVRYSGEDVRDGLPMPCELLVTNGGHTFGMPALAVASPGPAPTWVCIHNQDFAPLRDRLTDLGVHYLVQANTDDRTLDLFLRGLLHRGPDRRREPRLPIGCDVHWTWKTHRREKATLLDLSPRALRLVTGCELPVGAMIDVELPAQLSGEALDVTARVERCSTGTGVDGERVEVLLAWDELEPERRARIEELVRGDRIGPRVAPLAPRPYVDGDGIPDWDSMVADAERRDGTRRVYREHVDAFGEHGTIGALGCDLSERGLCIEPIGDAGVGEGESLTLALHAGDADEPLLVSGVVHRRNTDGSIVVVFGELDADQHERIGRILAALPALSSLGSDVGAAANSANRVVAAEILGD